VTTELPTKDAQSPMDTWVAGLREAALLLRASYRQPAYWVGLAADHLPKVTAEVDCLKQEIARYESARIVLALELKNAQEARARAEEERDEAKQLAVRQANEIRRMQAAIGGSAREAWSAGSLPVDDWKNTKDAF
jgi:hypothetical protein